MYVPSWRASQFDRYVDDAAIVYMLHMTTNKVIDEITDIDIDNTLCQQYADLYRTPWSRSPELVSKFFSSNKPILTRFLTKKILSAVTDASCFVKRTLPRDLRSELTKRISENNEATTVSEATIQSDNDHKSTIGCIKPIPLTASIVNQIDNLLSSLDSQFGMSTITSTYVSKYSQYINIKNQDWLGDLDALKQLVHVYKNTMHIDRPLTTDNGGIFLPDNIRNTLCKYTELFVSISENDKTDNQFFFAKLANDFIGIILSCYIPYDQLYPLTEEEFYQRYVIKGSKNQLFNKVTPYIREYSGMNLGYVLKMPLMININQTFKDNSMKYTNTINESSLSERYLMYYVYHALIDPKSISNVPLIKRNKS